MEIVGALLAGAFIGAVLGFIGAGGAMLSVPILIYIFDFSALEATTAALVVVFTAAASGLIPKIRAKQVLFREGFVISGLGSITNLGGSWLTENLSDRTITTGFAFVIILAGSMMLVKPNEGEHKRMSHGALLALSLFIGLMTGLFGVGGGFLAIPVLVLAFNTPAATAAGTSMLIIMLNTAIAFIGHAHSWSDVQWQIPLTMAVGAFVVANIASHRSSRSSSDALRISFAVLLYLVAAFTLARSWII